MTLDAPRPVRPGEELDEVRLAQFLGAPWVRVAQFPKGHSNLTYLVTTPEGELVVRRPPVGSKVKSAHDMGREARILEKLHPVFPLAPRVVKVCDDPSVLGAPFYAMERIRGAILRGPAPPDAPPDMGPPCAELVRTLARLHAVDWRAAGLTGKPEGYVRRQVEGWTQRWRDAQTEEVPEATAVARWLAERIPAQSGAAFIHNDFKYDNLVWSEDYARVVGVLDWEMATAGDPLMDLGTSLAYWVEEGDPDPLKMMSFGPTFLPGSSTRAGLVEQYARITGREVSGMPFYLSFGLFKNAVIVQQIYKRYVEGLTKDERFAVLGAAATLLARTAAEAAARGRV